MDFWEKFVVFIAVLFAFFLLAKVVPKIVAAIGRRARCWPWRVTQTRYVARVALLVIGVLAAFGSVGVSYDVLFLGVVVAGATTSVGAVVSNAISGIIIQSDGTVQPGKVLTVRGKTGVVVDTDLRHVRVLILERSGENGWRRTGRHLYVPNSVLSSEPYEAAVFSSSRSGRSGKTEVTGAEATGARGARSGLQAPDFASRRGDAETHVEACFESVAQGPFLGSEGDETSASEEGQAEAGGGGGTEFGNGTQFALRTARENAFPAGSSSFSPPFSSEEHVRQRFTPPVHVQRNFASAKKGGVARML